MWCVGILLMFCQSPDPAPVVDTFCLKYRPVRLSHADTRGTKEQADINNRVWKSSCGKEAQP